MYGMPDHCSESSNKSIIFCILKKLLLVDYIRHRTCWQLWKYSLRSVKFYINTNGQCTNKHQTLKCYSGHFQVQKTNRRVEVDWKKNSYGWISSLLPPHFYSSQRENGEFVKRSQWIKVMLCQAACPAAGVLTLGRPERQRMCHLHPDQWILGRGPKNGVGLRTEHSHQSLSHYTPRWLPLMPSSPHHSSTAN